LLSKHRNGSRFVDFGHCTIINYPKVSLLIKNMPVDDSAMYGRYKDLLPHILEATNAKIKDMEVSEEALSQVELIGRVFEELSEQLTGIGGHHSIKVNELGDLLQQIEALSDKQLTTKQAETLAKLHQHFSFVDDELSIIKFKLSDLTEVRHRLIESLNKIAKPWGEDEVAAQTDIELF
jgi:hypothetical protein